VHADRDLVRGHRMRFDGRRARRQVARPLDNSRSAAHQRNGRLRKRARHAHAHARAALLDLQAEGRVEVNLLRRTDLLNGIPILAEGARLARCEE
jgi:hypothetical protein